MIKITNVLLIYILFMGTVFTQSSVVVTINTGVPGVIIPSDFSGLSFETSALLFNNFGVKGCFFDSTNTQLVTLFKNLGIKNLRIGGGSVDDSEAPSHDDIDALFRFAKAAGVKVIYSVRLAKGDSLQDGSIAKYVWDNYKNLLDYFAIGNEPNLKGYWKKDPIITDYNSFYAKWKRFFKVVADSVPDARFGGPDNGTAGKDWATNLANAEKESKNFKIVFCHFYVGGFPKQVSAQDLIEGMLSPSWDTKKYLEYFQNVGEKVLALGIPYRFTESNSYVVSYPGVWGGNNCFATALYVLDYMHWWAAHKCSGVNFHTVLGKYNGTVYPDSNGNYQVYPMGYGIKAFDLGGHGRVQKLSIDNPDSLNLTAYSVADDSAFYVTVINKEYGSGARRAALILNSDNFSSKACVMYLKSADNKVNMTSGITLGGATLNNFDSFEGRWTKLESVKKHVFSLKVPKSSAVVIKILNQ